MERIIVRYVKGVVAFPSTRGVFSPRKEEYKTEEGREIAYIGRLISNYGSRLGLKQESLLLLLLLLYCLSGL
jgi:hypothetical protein